LAKLSQGVGRKQQRRKTTHETCCSGNGCRNDRIPLALGGNIATVLLELISQSIDACAFVV